MQDSLRIRISLAKKISLLFGSAVLLVITATLLFPWQQMTALNRQVFFERGKQMAQAVVMTVDLNRSDWVAAQEELDRCWPRVAFTHDLPIHRPRLIVAVEQPTRERLDAREPIGVGPGGGFQRQAIYFFLQHPRDRYYWRTEPDQQTFRLAMAIRATEVDEHPDALRGIVDIRLPTVRDYSRTWNWVITVLAGASGAVLAILVFYLVTQRLVLSKLKTLRRVADRVAAGDVRAESGLASRDEFQDLSEAFDNMLAHLRNAQASLDVKLGELAETNVSLYESNRIKSEFLSNVSHELRTPLASIIGFAELLRDSWDNPNADRKRLRRFAENILTSGRGLLDIINDLLDLAKIEAGKMDLHLYAFPIHELCGDLIDFVQPLADKRRQTLVYEADEQLPEFYSDSGKIKQILYNLLSNAIKFSPVEGTVSLTLRKLDDQHVELTVSDNGPGIPADKLDTIFEKFMQLDASRTREHEGTGLGLAITKNLTDLLGGMISVKSVEGKGATFTVRLPARITRTTGERIPS